MGFYRLPLSSSTIFLLITFFLYILVGKFCKDRKKKDKNKNKSRWEEAKQRILLSGIGQYYITCGIGFHLRQQVYFSSSVTLGKNNYSIVKIWSQGQVYLKVSVLISPLFTWKKYIYIYFQKLCSSFKFIISL